MKLGSTSWGLVNGGSANKGLRCLVGETCNRRLPLGTTWVALPTINLVQASSVPLIEDAQFLIPIIRRLRENAALRHDGPHSLLVLEFSRPDGNFVVGFPGDVAMAAQFGRSPFASPPAPDLGTAAPAARNLLQALHNVQSNRTLRRSSAVAQVPYPSFVGIMCSSAMADNAASATHLFPPLEATSRRYWMYQNGGPHPFKPGKALSTTVSPDTFIVTV